MGTVLGIVPGQLIHQGRQANNLRALGRGPIIQYDCEAITTL